MKIVSILATTALLGACASTPAPSPTVGTAVFDTTTASYVVTQDGKTYTLPNSALHAFASQGSMSYYRWLPSGSFTSGFSLLTTQGNHAVAGLEGGTYFAGVSGTLSGVVPTGGTANLTGGYAFVVNGVDQTGPLAITANFGTGVIADTSAGIDVNGTISGGNISGTVLVGGETGNLGGGFYDIGAGGYRLVGAAVGANMAGILAAQ
jgi:hypothetical protein